MPRRLALRQELAILALAELHAWLLASRRTIAAGSGTANAIEHLEALTGTGALRQFGHSADR
jgi:phage-related minor tail protein